LVLQAYKVPQFDKRLAKEIEFRGGEGTIDQTSYVAPEALRRMMKRSVTVTAPPIGERSIVMTVSVCLFGHDHISASTRQICNIFVHVIRGRGSVLIRRRSDTLFTSGFMDDVMFARDIPAYIAVRKRRALEVVPQMAATGGGVGKPGDRRTRNRAV